MGEADAGQFASPDEKAKDGMKRARWLRRALLDLKHAHSYVAGEKKALPELGSW